MTDPVIVIRRGRERSLLRRHPWIFNGSIASTSGDPASGATVAVRSEDGAFLAWGQFSPQSSIRARVWSLDERLRPGPQLIEQRVRRAWEMRAALLPGLDAVRVLNAESDGLPGVTADRFGDVIILQLTSAGAVYWREAIIAALVAVTGCTSIVEHSDSDAMRLEGLAPCTALAFGPEPARSIVIEEGAVRYGVEPAAGQKTGFYLDQRDNRGLMHTLAAGRDVLDCFCYSGGFALNAAMAGAASVTAIDSSGPALERAQANASLNNVADRVTWLEQDVFSYLRKLRDMAKSYDLIVLDPPKLAPTSAHAERATRAYKDLNLLAFKLLRKNGLLLTFSCSGGVDRALFQKVIAGAAQDAGVSASVLRHLGPGADHPVALSFPEGDYLKGLLCGVDR
ncbi:MAG: class I SAM-dependent rRNA methyltransferase [Gammaproteobacteria bacterium]|nr:class I SAM-dependent rRNA methyltransferase [Gammaproteobacteria bacterium]